MAVAKGTTSHDSSLLAGSRRSLGLVDPSIVGSLFDGGTSKMVKVKLKGLNRKQPASGRSKGNEALGQEQPDQTAAANDAKSPLINPIDERAAAAFPTGRPLEDKLDLVQCKHCRRPVDRSVAAAHIRSCLDKKQEKLKKKKEAKEAKDAAARKDKGEKVSEAGGEDGDGQAKSMGARKSALAELMDEVGAKKGKKRKAEGDAGDKAPKAKKKKDEPKAKVPKPKGPVDVERQCGVILPNGQQCARSLTCKSHSMGAKRAVPGRSKPYDMLLAAYQKQNQAKQQRAAIDANAPLHDDFEMAGGPIDSEEEKDAVMAAIARARPQPLANRTLISLRSKYQYVRMKEMLHNALGGSRGSGLFSTGVTADSGGRSVFRAGSVDASAINNAVASPLNSAGLEAVGGFDSQSRRSSFAHRAVTDGQRHIFPGQLPGPSRKSSTSGLSIAG